MNTVLIMLGSNFNREQNIAVATEKLSTYFQIVAHSSRLTTEPFGTQYKSSFQNEALKILSDLTAEETKATFKKIEREMGRTPETKQLGLIPIDIDLIFWNDTLMHRDYERFPFVKTCIDEVR